MKCPKDGTQLKTMSAYDLTLDVCPQCHGVWLDAGELPRLVTQFSYDQKKIYENWKQLDGDGKTAPRDFWSETTEQCPLDGTDMSRHYFGGNSGVGIEQCPQCRGFWFDGDELQEVAKAVAPNMELDAAIMGAASALREHHENDPIHKNTDPIVDVLVNPKMALPLLKDLLINLMIGVIVGSRR